MALGKNYAGLARLPLAAAVEVLGRARANHGGVAGKGTKAAPSTPEEFCGENGPPTPPTKNETVNENDVDAQAQETAIREHPPPCLYEEGCFASSLN